MSKILNTSSQVGKTRPKRSILPEGVTFTQIPDWFLTKVAHALSPTELRVMLYIYLHTLGYGKSEDAISYSQFTDGIVTRAGERLDYGANVSRRALVDALASLEKRGLISRGGTGGKFSVAVFRPVLIFPQENCENFEEGRVVNDGSNTNGETATRPVVKPESQSGKVGREVELARVEEVQNLPPGETYQVQILPATATGEVQILHSTKEFSTHEHENPGGGIFYSGSENVAGTDISLPPSLSDTSKEDYNCGAKISLSTNKKLSSEEIQEEILFLTSNVPGLGKTEATKLVEVAFSNNRGHTYLAELVSYVTITPSIRNPAAVLTTLVYHNAVRTPALSGGSYSASHTTRFTKDGSTPGPVYQLPKTRNAKGGIDFSKFEPGGKYAWLAG